MFKILYHIASNSNSYVLVILGCIIAVYETWQNYDKITKNIFSTVVYSIIFLFGIFVVNNFPVLIICCSDVKRKVKILNFLSNLKQIDEVLEFDLNYLIENDKDLYNELITRFSSLVANINKVLEILNKKKEKISLQNHSHNTNDAD